MSSNESRADPLLTSLRDRTRDLHNSVEARMNLPARLATLDDYRLLLERFHGFYVVLEQVFSSTTCLPYWLQIGIDFEPRRKLRLLKDDLSFLGLSDTQIGDLARLPADWLPPPKSSAELSGYAYVVEGATLGGTFISRAVEHSLGLPARRPGTLFFGGYGASTGSMWRQFRVSVDAFALREETFEPGATRRIVENAVNASRCAFEAMDMWVRWDAAASEAKA